MVLLPGRRRDARQARARGLVRHERAVTAIAQVHRSHGVDWPRSHPALTEVLAGIRRRLGTAPLQKAPVVDQKLVALL
jgi:hypothetical protein